MFIDLIARFSTVAAAEALPSDIYNYCSYPFDPVCYMPLLTHAVLVANADYRPALAANFNGSPSIVNWDPRTLQRVYLYRPTPDVPDVPARAMLAKRVKFMPGLAHHTAQDVCDWFATACKKQKRKERAEPLVPARELPPQALGKESRKQAKKESAVDSKPIHVRRLVHGTAERWLKIAKHEDIIMLDESTSRAPGALLNNSISHVDASGDAVLDTRQMAADRRAAFPLAFVEKRHRCPRTFVELGPWFESLQ
ncbi:hypothetical protein DICSQDRAFT_175004 [Dichomitus squalens LYAD-421 SS1]|uniref:Uncharacterized protein n=1 Tax=Dichomitus squalens (strain LYAD-421) TaxID=732165 RepID=R7SMU8_DICSQ|nr:uncharacterized protein DICSQDRAFT_175004 [Dichomitus squalens LYAD-421 SS1]EJF56322.1 hypothetical protein DICSQDRAFT_175004 [Dichomitus squalens LYAD-421 SS1]